MLKFINRKFAIIFYGASKYMLFDLNVDLQSYYLSGRFLYHAPPPFEGLKLLKALTSVRLKSVHLHVNRRCTLVGYEVE